MLKKKKEMEAIVISNKMDKTVVVEIRRLVRHPVFKKYHTKKRRYKAHDEKNECGIGDRVLIRETKPISKEKRWAVVKIVEKAA